jgi:hypothetical protein
MTALEVALEYIDRGWSVVPIPHKKKKPLGEEWPGWRITKADAHQRFNGGPQNVGVILGEASGGLADVDLDTIEAVRAGPYFLPRTLCFGRPSKPRSHWIYQSDLWQTEDKAALPFKFTTGSGKDRKEQMILELRIGGGGKGAQTIFPGSVHETGELITWDEKADIARAEGDDIKQRCGRAAAAALIAQHFPSKGARHDAGLTLGGFLSRCGFSRPDAELFAEAVTVASGQLREKVRDVRKAASEAWDEGNRPGGKARGFPAFAETFGDDVAKHVAKWLGYQGNARDDAAAASHEPFFDGDAWEAPPHPGLDGEDRLPPPPDRSRFILSAWLDRDIPPRDYLLGGVMCTTSRWFIYGETGIGKTLFSMEFTAAIAAAAKFLRWPGQRRSRVMYLDGEMPVETFRERTQLIAGRYGRDLEFYGYNREDLGDGGMPPLNTPVGQAWLRREIDAIKPDIIVFDSIMCLLIGSMKEEETWAPMKALVCELSARRIAQVWLNHANDIGKSYGDKTRLWEMDTVAKLSPVEGDDGAIRFEFEKARLRTSANADQFEPVIFRPGDDWSFSAKAGAQKARRWLGLSAPSS